MTKAGVHGPTGDSVDEVDGGVGGSACPCRMFCSQC